MARRSFSAEALGSVPPDLPVLAISVAATLADMHPQTLRQYDRLGLVVPKRTSGGGRRYSLADVARLREVQRLSQEEGITLEGIRRILDLEDQLARAKKEIARLREVVARDERVFVASSSGMVMAMSEDDHARMRRSVQAGGLQVWRPMI